MSVQDLLSEQPPADPDPERRTVDAAANGEVLEALATDTARRVATALHDSPGTASEVAAETDISLQSVGYHLDRLQEVGLVEVVGTRYSSKAKEMDVYAPTSAPIVVQFGGEDARQ